MLGYETLLKQSYPNNIDKRVVSIVGTSRITMPPAERNLPPFSTVIMQLYDEKLRKEGIFPSIKNMKTSLNYQLTYLLVSK